MLRVRTVTVGARFDSELSLLSLSRRKFHPNDHFQHTRLQHAISTRLCTATNSTYMNYAGLVCRFAAIASTKMTTFTVMAVSDNAISIVVVGVIADTTSFGAKRAVKSMGLTAATSAASSVEFSSQTIHTVHTPLNFLLPNAHVLALDRTSCLIFF